MRERCHAIRRRTAFPSASAVRIVTEPDALRFACNAINVGRTIVLNKVSSKLSGELEHLGFKVIQVELTEFLKAGGAAKCLVMKLSKHVSVK